MVRLSAIPSPRRTRRVKTPIVLQMETVECGAAALGIILAYYGRYVPLEELRLACAVTRDGSKAANLLKAAQSYGLLAKGLKHEPEGMRGLHMPVIVFWNFYHFVVVEGFGKERVYLNDPAVGTRTVNAAEFDQAFTGIVLTFEPGPEFRPGDARPSTWRALRARLAGAEPALLYILLASLALVGLGLAAPTFTRLFVDRYLIDADSSWVVPILAGLAIVIALTALFTYLQQVMLLRMQTKLAVTTSSAFLWHVLRLPIRFYQQRHAGEIVTRVAINDAVATVLTGPLATNCIGVALIIFYAALMLRYDAVLGAVAVVVGALNLIALRVIAGVRTDQNRKLLQERGLLAGTAASGLRMIESLKASGLEDEFFVRWAGYEARVRNVEQRLGLLTQVISNVPPLLASLTTVLILGLGGLRVIGGDITLGTLTAFQALVIAFMAPLGGLVDLGTQIQETEGNLARLDDVLRHEEDSRPAEEHVSTPARLQGRLELRKVTFGYSPLAPPLIEDFSLTMEPGARVALVGESGSGKSTVAKLVAGLYTPWGGEILFDGMPRQSIAPAVLNTSLAVADQEITLFGGTVRENLTMWDAGITDSSVLRAAKDAAIHDEIAERAGGYGALVEEDGRNFSGGQRQRLEIARALATNPTILVLDEATSALDPVTEQQVDENLRRRGCTCLIIAHRLSTIRDCDEILVLEGGKVVQRGTHQEMQRIPGPYARLIRAGETSRVRRVLEDL